MQKWRQAPSSCPGAEWPHSAAPSMASAEDVARRSKASRAASVGDRPRVTSSHSLASAAVPAHAAVITPPPAVAPMAASAPAPAMAPVAPAGLLDERASDRGRLRRLHLRHHRACSCGLTHHQGGGEHQGRSEQQDSTHSVLRERVAAARDLKNSARATSPYTNEWGEDLICISARVGRVSPPTPSPRGLSGWSAPHKCDGRSPDGDRPHVAERLRVTASAAVAAHAAAIAPIPSPAPMALAVPAAAAVVPARLLDDGAANGG